MFGFEKKFTGRKIEQTEVIPAEENVGEPEDYNVDMGRRNFLRQSAAVAATAGMAAVGMSPESAEAAGNKMKIELAKNISLSEHGMKLLNVRLGQIVPTAESVQIVLDHTQINSHGVNQKFSSIKLNVITSTGEVLDAKGMVFGTINDEAGISRMLSLALDDLKVKAENK